jgi:hypothetical protein
MVASKRRVTLTRLVKSSAKPKAKAGKPASNQGANFCCKSAGSTNQAAPKPATMGKPPMRGVGWAWTF